MNTGFFKLGSIDPSNNKAGSYVIFATQVTLATVEVSVLLSGSNSNVKYVIKYFLSMATNIGAYFEIPVTDLDRAINFYQSLLGIELERGSIHGYEMAFFPFENNGAGISGALCKGDVYKPSIDGSFIYLFTSDIDEVLSKAVELGSEILFEKTDAGNCFVAEIKDTEGNRICFTTRN